MLVKGLPQGTALHKVQGLLPTGRQRAVHDSICDLNPSAGRIVITELNTFTKPIWQLIASTEAIRGGSWRVR